MDIIDYSQFESVHLLVGTIVRAEAFPEARKPAYKLWVDFGKDHGIKQTSAQITVHYTPDDLIGRQVIGCVNLGKKKIAGFESDFLVTGLSDENGAIVLITTERPVPNGAKLH